MSLAVQFKITPENTAKAYYSLDDYVSQIGSYVENTVRASSPKMSLDDLFESQNYISNNVMTSLEAKMHDYGYIIENTLITAMEPSREVKDALNKINASQRLKEAAINEAEALYIRDVKQAEADRDRKALQGAGIAQHRTAIIKSFELSVDSMASKLGIMPRDIIDFVVQTQHLDAIESIGRSNNAKTIFIDHAKIISNNSLASQNLIGVLDDAKANIVTKN